MNQDEPPGERLIVSHHANHVCFMNGHTALSGMHCVQLVHRQTGYGAIALKASINGTCVNVSLQAPPCLMCGTRGLYGDYYCTEHYDYYTFMSQHFHARYY